MKQIRKGIYHNPTYCLYFVIGKKNAQNSKLTKEILISTGTVAAIAVIIFVVALLVRRARISETYLDV